MENLETILYKIWCDLNNLKVNDLRNLNKYLENMEVK